jgi:tRNA (pseudouridine54-N1)-methyltransferase
LRPNVELLTLHLGPPAAPKVVRMRSGSLRHLNPDERTTAMLLEKALGTPTTGPVWQDATPGVSVAVLSFDELLDGLADRPLVLLDEAGEDAAKADVPEDATFVLGDHLGLAPEEIQALDRRGARRVSVGPVSLQADQCIVVLHNHLDRRRPR